MGVGQRLRRGDIAQVGHLPRPRRYQIAPFLSISELQY